MATQVEELEQFVIGHFLHPHHRLARTHKDGGFNCNGCQTAGRGTRYRCDPCDFDLHIYCAFCPPTILSPLHPQHKLILITKLCGICSKFIEERLCYRCYDCELEFHSECVHLPVITWSPATFASKFHRHKLRPFIQACNDCRESIKGMLYRCHNCEFDIHPLCHQRTILQSSAGTGHHAVAGSKLYFFMHPAHELIFVERSPNPSDDAEELRSRWCAVCGGLADGNCYMCMPCGFRVHRDCASIRPAVSDKVHPAHSLHYQRSKPSPCVVCKKTCVLWRYHCSACYVHVHKDCHMGPAPPTPDDPNATTASSLSGLSISGT